MAQRLDDDPRFELQRLEDAATPDIREAVAQIALAPRMHRHVDGQHQRAEPVIARPADHASVTAASFAAYI